MPQWQHSKDISQSGINTIATADDAVTNGRYVLMSSGDAATKQLQHDGNCGHSIDTTLNVIIYNLMKMYSIGELSQLIHDLFWSSNHSDAW